MSRDLPPGRWVLTDSRGVPVPGVTVTSVELRRKPEQPSGIGDIHCTIPAGEPLAKVLPAGEPLVSTWWVCPRCSYQQRGGPPGKCMFNAEPADCPLA